MSGINQLRDSINQFAGVSVYSITVHVDHHHHHLDQMRYPATQLLGKKASRQANK